MKRTLASITIICLALTACTPPPANVSTTTDETAVSLAEASYSVSRSLTDLSETAQAAHPLPKQEPPPSPASYGMGQLTSVDWSGPIEPLVRQIAKSTGYRMTVLGTPPAIPIIVTIYEKNAMMADILRNAGYQCGRRASVLVFPENRVIELRYAKN
jgi:defect-in-organelle-trafficking protein DotD